MEFGVTTFGVLREVFMSDSFRSGLMRFIRIKPSELAYEHHVQVIGINVANKVADCVGINLYRLFDVGRMNC